ncbi:MAG: NUDIX domain-containing protein [Litorilinea sp.]
MNRTPDSFYTILSTFSTLTKGGRRGNGFVYFVPFDDEFSRSYSSHSYVIPFLDRSTHECIVTRKRTGQWFLPGGTLELGENWRIAAVRELREEIGAEIIQLHPFGMYVCVSESKTPAKPHLPHPIAVRVISWADVRPMGTEFQPVLNDDIVEVRCVPVQMVDQTFSNGENVDFGELYHFAHKLRKK